ncbi:beta strand repeat-containing protein [Arsenicibacter rosenii]|uniref:Uncharacterized protein n=1 Tax=Arsenicibacter rosenii TaxID=1750698 RepID=A0A1S2VKS7_9BACT|nr:hypothetical protein [Arsenicibacter rosenii]OIN59010.1 hypothetical protein BLX24_12410 [Arsenicibacter rosenii]
MKKDNYLHSKAILHQHTSLKKLLLNILPCILFTLLVNHSVFAQTGECSSTLSITAGPCTNNLYTLSGVINLTNTPASSLTILDGSATVEITVPANTTSVGFTINNLQAGSGTHVVTVFSSATACNVLDGFYDAPPACSTTPCSISLVTNVGACTPATNVYSLTGILTASNVSSPPLAVTITTGTRTVVQSLTANNNNFVFVLNNLPSDGQLHPITVATSSLECPGITDTYAAPASCSVSTPCSATVSLSPTACNSVNNSYTLNGLISIANVPASGTITITNGSLTATSPLTTSIGTYGFTFNNLPSTGGTGTINVTFTGADCGPVSQTYAIPAACSVAMPCSKTLTLLPTACNPANNSYTLNGTVNVSNGPASGVLTLSTAGASITFAVGSANGNYTFNFGNLPANGTSSTVTASFSDTSCSPVTETYTAPVACSVTLPCSLSLALTPGSCNSATNGYSLTAVLTANNITPPMTVTLSGAGFNSSVQTLTAINNVLSVNITNLTADGSVKTISVATSATACGTISQTYTAPTACSAAPPCSVSLALSPGACNSATNSYTLSGAVFVANGPSSGSLTVSNGTSSLTFPISPTIGTYSFNFNNLPSNGAAGTITVTFTGTSCGPVSQTYTAPAACTVAQPCGLLFAVSPTACNPATNTYTLEATLLANNVTPPLTVTITGAGAPIIQSLTTVSNTFNFTIVNLSADGLPHMLSVATSATACGGISQTYTAPTACTAAVPLPCSVSLTLAPSACNPATNSYTLSGAVNVANGPSSGTLTVSNGVQSVTYAIAANVGTYSFNFNNLTSNGAIGTITATFSGTSCGPVSQTYTAPTACTTAAPACSLSLTASQPVCSLTANAYSVSGVVTIANGTGSQTLTVSDGVRSTTVVIAGSGSANFVLTNLTSDGATHTISVVSSATACGTTSRTYTAPANCQGPCPQLNLLILNNAQICNGQCASFSLSTDATGIIELVQFSTPQTGTAVYTGGVVLGEGTPVNGALVIPQGIPGLSLPQNNGSTPVTYYIYARLKTPSADPNCRPFGEAQVTILPSPQLSMTSLQTCSSSTTRQVVLSVAGSGTYVATFGTGANAVSCALKNITGQVASFTITGGTTTTATLPVGFAGAVLVSNLTTGCQTMSGVAAVTYFPAPAFTATATPVSCSGVTANADAQLSLGSLQNATAYQYVSGNTFSSATAIPAAPTQIPGNGIIATGLANPTAITGQPYTVRVYSNSGCYTDQTVTLTRKDCACPPAACVPVTATRIR